MLTLFCSHQVTGKVSDATIIVQNSDAGAGVMVGEQQRSVSAKALADAIAARKSI